MNSPRNYAALLRHELSVRNTHYALRHRIAHVVSYGTAPTVVYPSSHDDREHGNFLSVSYKAILARPEWKRRLAKVHTQAARSLPRSDRRWKELDSSMSSDALLMNVFCYPRVTGRRQLSLLLGTEIGDIPEFGFRPRVPLHSGLTERTEVDMKLGTLLVEAKLTEGNFQIQNANIVEGYGGLQDVFDCKRLPRSTRQYRSYQLLRNVLAAHVLNLSFCVLLDARRPDLIEDWYTILRCIRITELRSRCKVLTWQELAEALPLELRRFLDLKYGIVPPGVSPSVYETGAQ